jgi:Phage integrase family
LRIHDLRHSFASFAVADGHSLFLIGKALGHKQTRTTEIYAHLSDDPVRNVADRTAAKIAAAMTPRAATRSAAEVVSIDGAKRAMAGKRKPRGPERRARGI